jgi:hypothetical protein
MTRGISRNSFNELKQYLSVHLQQGRAILDSDWNEAQDILATLSRRLGQDTLGDGVVGSGFEVLPVIPTPWGSPAVPTFLTTSGLFDQSYAQGHLPTSTRFPPPGAASEPFESLDGWTISGTGKMRLSRDRPYEGTSFLRVSDTSGTVTVSKALSSPLNLAALQYGHYRFRVNAGSTVFTGGVVSFFIQDGANRRNTWALNAPQAGRDRWAIGAAQPLDLRFQLFDIDLLPAIKGKQYTSLIPALGTTASLTWSSTGLPTGLSCNTTTAGGTPLYGRISGQTDITGTFTVNVTANAGGPTATRAYTLRVMDPPSYAQLLDFTNGGVNTANQVMLAWNSIKPRGTNTGGAVDLTNITSYGFVFTPQASGTVWDFDALYFSSRNLVHTLASNNFVIAGPSARIFVDHFMNRMQVSAGDGSILLPSADDYELLYSSDTPRAYVGGLPLTLGRDTLYTSQADPADPVIATPTTQRKDLVYLDVWSEPVTYVEDPELREVALGGPDTSTRMRVRHRVRVAQGVPAATFPAVPALPTGNGTGGGRLATEGTYSGRSNRLYLVEVDTPGDIGTAKVRWSDDNASTIQRVIEAIPPSSTKVKVEDASAYQAGDLILIRTDGKEEEHLIQSVVGNTITLQEATGASVTFALADRPKVQRWNAFHAPILVDSNDSTISAQVSLSFDVKVRFAGAGLKKGDFWTFRTRFLAGDGAAGTSDAARIEAINFQPPQGVVHYYAPLAHIIRDGSFAYADRVQVVRDMRRTGGGVLHVATTVDDQRVNPGVKVRGVHAIVGQPSFGSTYVCVFSGSASADVNGRSLLFGIETFNSFFDGTGGDVGTTLGFASAETAFSCDSGTSNVKRTAIVTFTSSQFDVVAVRPTLQLVGGAGFVDVSSVKVDIFELRGNLRRIAASQFIE